MTEPSISRRRSLKVVGATLGAAAFARALAPLTELSKTTSVAEFLQKHYKELDAAELAELIERLEFETRARYGAEELSEAEFQEAERAAQSVLRGKRPPP